MRGAVTTGTPRCKQLSAGRPGLQEREAVGFQHDAGQCAPHHRAGVDADAVAPDLRPRARRVAVHHHGAEIGRGREERLADPKLVVAGLLRERHAGPQAGMDEEVAAERVAQGEAAQEGEMRGWEPRGPGGGVGADRDAPTVQGIGAAVHHPGLDRRIGRRVDGGQHQVFVVAHEVDDGADAGEGCGLDQAADDPGGVRAAIDVVAEVDQPGVLDRAGGEVFGDGGVDGGELVEAAVYVADGIDAGAGRQGCGGRDEIGHSRRVACGRTCREGRLRRAGPVGCLGRGRVLSGRAS